LQFPVSPLTQRVGFAGGLFGLFPLVHTTLSLNPKLPSIKGPFGQHQIQITNGLLESFEWENGTTESAFQYLDALPLTHRNALAFSSAFQYFLSEQVAADIPESKDFAKEAMNKVVFEKLGWGLLVFFLAILLINFVCFQYLSDQNQELKQKESMFSGNLDEVARLNKAIKEKEEFLEKTGWKTPSKLSFYSDKIASTVPVRILLAKMELYPVKFETINSEKKIKINTQEIRISGNCPDPNILNNWVLQLKYFEWIKTIKVIDYQFDGTNKTSVFTIQLELN
ncbi:MAG: hypothetical protein K2Q22_11345, partial [Cytophagales bacterium]|nr:hypothetical protein [Cytophagales bacterium]